MLYEDRIVNGVLCYRYHPGYQWTQFTPQELSARIEMLREKVRELEMAKQIKICVSFENEEELEKAKSQVPENVSISDYIRKKAFKLPHRNKKAGAPKGNKNNPHGRRKRDEGI